MSEIFISTFLGFLSALLVEYLVERYGDKILLRSTLNGIQLELQNVKEKLDILGNDMYYVDPLDTSYWKSISHTQNLNCLLSHPLYNRIVTVYQYIETVNRWECIRSLSYFMNSSPNLDLNNALSIQRSELEKEVDTLLTNL